MIKCFLILSKREARAKSRSVKKNSKRKVWKPTGKVFTNIGYIWRPTGRTFTIVGNACPLTRITTTTEVPLRKPITLDNDTPKPTATLVYSRKPRKSKTNVPVSNPKILQSVVQIVLWYLDSGCSKHMTGDRSQLTNFVSKFLGTVKFRNDHVAKIMGYGDYQIGNVTISRETVRRIRIDNGTEFVNQTLREYYKKVGISHETSVARSPQQNGVVERRNRTLIEAARTMLIYAKAPLFLWAEAVATACYTQNRSMIRLRHELGQVTTEGRYSCTAMASEHSSSGHALHEMTLATISSGLVPNPHPLTPFVPPSRTDWDILFQPTLPSTTLIQDAPSPSNSQTTPETPPPVIPNDVEEDNHDIKVAHMGNDPYIVTDSRSLF
ncbi:retrovirus-related pol polyprotein from transposon TNT 1-94 [Tanacetum coccineum]|uniref:Retrovirus-related pol polyprotein from transposon TNT 1-94 n=1 Tax=Tanacetum coccineum TaxID=301880 RepID=A0ABQ5BRP1_9ASTR